MGVLLEGRVPRILCRFFALVSEVKLPTLPESEIGIVSG